MKNWILLIIILRNYLLFVATSWTQMAQMFQYRFSQIKVVKSVKICGIYNICGIRVPLRLMIYGSIIFLAQNSLAQKPGHDISVKIKGISPTQAVYLVYFYGENFLIADTSKAEPDGQSFRFKGDKALEGGLYFLGYNNKKGPELVIDREQYFSVEADTADINGSITFKNSEDNTLYYDYIRYLEKQRKSFDAISTEKNLVPKSADYQAEAKKAQEESNEYIKKFFKKNKQSFTTKLLKSYFEPDLPEIKNAEGKTDSMKLYLYHRAHYFDNLDLTDERMLRTPAVMMRINSFFKHMSLVQTRDSVTKEIDQVMSLAKGKAMRKNIVLKFAKKYEIPTLLGLDGTYPHILEKYYVNEPELWDSSTVKNAAKVLGIQKPIIMGSVIPDMMLGDTLGNPLPLSGVKSKYTVLYIYNPDCGACKVTTPKLPAFADSLAKKVEGVTFYVASIGHDPKRWREFIAEAKIGRFLNGMDLYGIVDFEKYNSYNFPNIYILDKDKRIRAKHMQLGQVEVLLQTFEIEEKMQAEAEKQKQKKE